MRPLDRHTDRPSRLPLFIALGLVVVLGVFLLNTLRSDSQNQSAIGVSTASLFTSPLDAATATPVPTTAPIELPTPTATAAPAATAEPTATTEPTEPTAAPNETGAEAEVSAPASVSVASSGGAGPQTTAAPATATSAPDPGPATTSTPVPVIEPTATPVATSAPTAVPVPTETPTPEPTSTPLPTPTPTPAPPVTTTAAMESYVLGEINTVRSRAGLGPLVLDTAISAIARDWSQQMASRGVIAGFNHRPGPELSALLPAGWFQWGENIARANDIAWAQSGLEQSAEHYANMVGNFTHVGIGVFFDGDSVWVTQNFARY